MHLLSLDINNLPSLKLIRSDNYNFIIGFFKYVYFNKNDEINNSNNIITQTIVENKLKNYINLYLNYKNIFDEKDGKDYKNIKNVRNYIENWIKDGYLRRIEIGDIEDDYEIELTIHSSNVIDFIDNILLNKEEHLSIKTDVDNAFKNIDEILFSSNDLYGLKEDSLEILNNQKRQIEEKIKNIENGNLDVSTGDVLDKYVSAKKILKSMPMQFKKIEGILENIYKNIISKGNEENINRGSLLKDTLLDITNNLNNSDQWQSFIGFEKYYLDRFNFNYKESLSKIFNENEEIKKLERERSIRDIIDIDINNAKRRVTKKKDFIIYKIEEIFNEESNKNKKDGLKFIKNIKSLLIDYNNFIKEKDDLIEIDDGFNIDLLIGKNFFKEREIGKLRDYSNIDEKLKKENIEDDLELINSIKEKKIDSCEVRKKLDDYLKDNKIKDINIFLNKIKIEYGIEEFLYYYDYIFSEGLGEIKKDEFMENTLEIKNNKYKIKSNKIILN